MKNKAIFLDLQGTLGGDCFGSILDFSFYPFAIDAIKRINDSSYLCIIITNQSKISKGILTYDDYENKMDDIKVELKKHGAYLDAVYCCPHSKEDGCQCKKPLPGMIEQAQMDYDIDLETSYLIGDMGISDMVLADKVNMNSILVLTGAGDSSLNTYKHLWKDVNPTYITEDVLEAVNWILGETDDD